MRSDSWDKKERESDSSGFMKPDKAEHEHIFDGITGKCIFCFKTREQLRREW